MFAVMMPKPSSRPMSGDRKMKMMVLVQPLAMIAAKPSAGSVAPIRPPASACEDEEGSPHHQVSRFQTMAPSSEAKITVSTMPVPCALSMENWITPVPMVLATFTPPPNAATKLKKAAQTTATPGASTRVDTTVAMELAASWNPLMKSKNSARTISATTIWSIYACSSTTPSMTLATSSQRSVAVSIRS